MGGSSVKEDQSMDFSRLSAEERLVAEQAVVTLRALTEAAARAPMGQGMNVLESVIHDKGFEHLRQMIAVAGASHSEAQKKGSASKGVAAAAQANSKVFARAGS
jgi:hypothetical protein